MQAVTDAGSPNRWPASLPSTWTAERAEGAASQSHVMALASFRTMPSLSRRAGMAWMGKPSHANGVCQAMSLNGLSS